MNFYFRHKEFNLRQFVVGFRIHWHQFQCTHADEREKNLKKSDRFNWPTEVCKSVDVHFPFKMENLMRFACLFHWITCFFIYHSIFFAHRNSFTISHFSFLQFTNALYYSMDFFFYFLFLVSKLMSRSRLYPYVLLLTNMKQKLAKRKRLKKREENRKKNEFIQH